MDDDAKYQAWISRKLRVDVPVLMSRDEMEEFYAETGEKPYGMQAMWGDADFAGPERGPKGLPGLRKHGDSRRAHAEAGEV